MLQPRLIYFVESAVANMRNNPLAVAGNLVALTLLLLLMGTSLIVYRGIALIMPAWFGSGKVIIYLSPQASAQDQERLVGDLEKSPEVADVRTVSQDEALELLKKQMGGWKHVLEGIRESFLPSSLEITLKTGKDHIEAMDGLVQKIRGYPWVEEVFHGKSMGES